MLKIIKFLILVLIPVLGIGQQTYNGIVLGKEGKKEIPLTGVNIYWKGTSFGTTSDVEGKFSINKNPKTDLLIIRFVGYRPDTINVTEAPNPMQIVLYSRHELDEVVVQARASGAHISRMTTHSTQKVTGQELHRAACCNLSESFTTNSSVDVSFSDALTGAKQIQLLGLSGRYVQLQTENIPNFYGLAKSFGLEYIPGNWMESISISKGAASVLNGYESITGQINVEYKKPQSSERIFLNLYTNDALKFEFNANASAHISDKLKTMVLAHTSYNDKRIDHNNDGFIDLPLLKQINLFNRWNFKASDKYNIQTGFKYYNEERLGGQMNFDHEDGVNSNLYGIDIETERLEAFIKNGIMLDEEKATSIGWINSASVHEQNSMYGKTNYYGDQKSFYSNLIFSTQIGKSHKHDHDNNMEHLVTKDHNVATHEPGHKEEEHHKHTEHEDHEKHEHANTEIPKIDIHHSISTGLSWKYDNYTEKIDSNTISSVENIPGAFFEYTARIPEKITFMAGIRVDHHNKYGVFITPRTHIKYDITKNTNLRMSAGKGFRSARVLAENNILLASSRIVDIQDNLKMEEAWNYGISLTQYLDLVGHELTISGDYFRTDFMNQIIVDLDSDVNKIGFYNLKGKSYSNNYQIQFDYKLTAQFDITTAFRYTDVKATYGGILLKKPLNSDYKGLLTLSYATKNGNWQIDFTSQFNGGGRIPSTEALPEKYQRPNSFDPYTILNMQTTRYLGAFEVYAGIENILNIVQKDPVIASDDPFSQHFDSSLIWGPVHGRKVYLGARFAIDR